MRDEEEKAIKREREQKMQGGLPLSAKDREQISRYIS
jgi:hypothetical protein